VRRRNWPHPDEATTALKALRFDPAKYLGSPVAQTEDLTAALETGNPSFIIDSLGVVARAHGMSQLARDTGLRRESLYKALSSEGNPEFATIMKVIQALGIQLSAGVAPG